jgi:hypothetical protein
MPSRPINPKKVTKTTNKLRKADAKDAAGERAAAKVRSGEYKPSKAQSLYGKGSEQDMTIIPVGKRAKEARAAKKDAKKTLKTSALRANVLVSKAAKGGLSTSKATDRILSSRASAQKQGAKAGMSDKKMDKIMYKTGVRASKKTGKSK